MNPAFRFLAIIPALLFLVSGVRWLTDPIGASATLGLNLQDGLGLSSQIGDFGAFFLASGVMMVLGILRKNQIWFLAPAMVIGFAALFRVVATVLHGAPLAIPMIAIEVVSAALLLIAAQAVKD
jgi:hypothetical protein